MLRMTRWRRQNSDLRIRQFNSLHIHIVCVVKVFIRVLVGAEFIIGISEEQQIGRTKNMDMTAADRSSSRSDLATMSFGSDKQSRRSNMVSSLIGATSDRK
jgi:hypothetical protein